MKRIICLVAGLLVASATVVPAQDAPAPQPAPAPAEAPHALPAANVKVTFKLIPADQGDQEMFVVSSGAYSSRRSFENGDTTHWMEVSGDLGPQQDGRLLLRLTVSAHYEGEENSAEFQTSSTLLLAPGKEVEVAKFGEKTLVVSFKPL